MGGSFDFRETGQSKNVLIGAGLALGGPGFGDFIVQPELHVVPVGPDQGGPQGDLAFP